MTPTIDAIAVSLDLSVRLKLLGDLAAEQEAVECATPRPLPTEIRREK